MQPAARSLGVRGHDRSGSRHGRGSSSGVGIIVWCALLLLSAHMTTSKPDNAPDTLGRTHHVAASLLLCNQMAAHGWYSGFLGSKSWVYARHNMFCEISVSRSISADNAYCAVVVRAYMRRRRLRQQIGSAAAYKAAALQGGASKGGGPAAGSLFIEDGADGCWVTFATDADDKRVLIGHGAFSKVGLPSRLCPEPLPTRCLAMHAHFLQCWNPLAVSELLVIAHISLLCREGMIDNIAPGVPGASRRGAEGGAQGAVDSGSGAAGHPGAAAARGGAAAQRVVRRQRGAVLRRQPAACRGRSARHGVSALLRLCCELSGAPAHDTLHVAETVPGTL